jgi:GT2 family glycosyltransferase
MDASIIIPVYGPIGYLIRCMRSIELHTASYELILVDNGTQHPIPKHSIEPVVIRNPQNTGFAHACNQGAAKAAGNVLVFLNVDTEVHEHWLPKLIEALKKPDAAIAGVKLVYPSGVLQHTGIEFYRIGNVLTARNRIMECSAGYVAAVTGACLAIRKEVFHEIGGFDERYYNGYDDVDLCLKAREIGWRIWYEPTCIITHMESATGPERWAKVHDNVAQLNQRWSDSPVPWRAP